jgi:hypothetical protein
MTDPIDWTRAEHRLKQLISLYVKSGCFPEELFGKEMFPLRFQFERGDRSKQLYEKIMNFSI